MTAVLKPSCTRPKAARSPAPPAPTTTASYSWSTTGYSREMSSFTFAEPLLTEPQKLRELEVEMDRQRAACFMAREAATNLERTGIVVASFFGSECHQNLFTSPLEFQDQSSHDELFDV